MLRIFTEKSNYPNFLHIRMLAVPINPDKRSSAALQHLKAVTAKIRSLAG
jgi:hypothetical protein